MNKTLTIVVPSYNVEKTLRDTLDSFIDERILEDLEVLIVNDGSKDSTDKIAKEYETKYPGTFRLISKENGGHGSTINRGIKECRGKYFKVVDGDDWVDTKDLVSLIERLKDTQADYVVTDYMEVNDVTKEEKAVTYDKIGNTDSMLFKDIAFQYQIGMHPLYIKSSILKDNNITLDEKCFYVDVEYVLYPIPYVETVRYFPLNVYRYRLDQVEQSVSIKGFMRHIDNHIKVIYSLTDFLEEYRKVGEVPKVFYIEKRIAQMVGDQITIFLSFDENDKKNKKKFMLFDRMLKKKSAKIYQLSGSESGTLKLLRRTKFNFYKTIVANARKRNKLA